MRDRDQFDVRLSIFSAPSSLPRPSGLLLSTPYTESNSRVARDV